jgi:hypothetical protein
MVDIEIMCGCKNRAALTAVVVVGQMVNACANEIRNGNIVAVVIIIFIVYSLSMVTEAAVVIVAGSQRSGFVSKLFLVVERGSDSYCFARKPERISNVTKGNEKIPIK